MGDRENFHFSCFTKHTPSDYRLRDPRGLDKTSPKGLELWQLDNWSQSPYQYDERNQVQHCMTGQRRRLVVAEEERISAYATGYTSAVVQLIGKDRPVEVTRARQSLIGNAWHMKVAQFWLGVLCVMAGISVGETLVTSPLQSHLFLNERALAFKEVYTHLKSACPYFQWRKQKGLPNDCALPPSWQDWFAHQAAALASGMQERSTCTPVTRKRLVPYGLTPEVHSVLAEGTVSPLDQDIDLSEDLEFAVAMTMEQGPAIASWRKRHWIILEKAFRRLAELNVLWNTDRSQASRDVSSHLFLAEHDAGRYSISWPDCGLADTICEGADIVEELPDFHVFRPGSVEPTFTVEELNEDNDAWVESLLSQPPPKAEDADVVWQKSEKERKRGVVQGWHSKEQLDAKYGKGKWRPLLRFRLDIMGACGSGHRYFCELTDALGWKFDPDTEQKPAHDLVFLGVQGKFHRSCNVGRFSYIA